jgi:hypothetical protein
LERRWFPNAFVVIVGFRDSFIGFSFFGWRHPRKLDN